MNSKQLTLMLPITGQQRMDRRNPSECDSRPLIRVEVNNHMVEEDPDPRDILIRELRLSGIARSRK